MVVRQVKFWTIVGFERKSIHWSCLLLNYFRTVKWNELGKFSFAPYTGYVISRWSAVPCIMLRAEVLQYTTLSPSSDSDRKHGNRSFDIKVLPYRTCLVDSRWAIATKIFVRRRRTWDVPENSYHPNQVAESATTIQRHSANARRAAEERQEEKSSEYGPESPRRSRKHRKPPQFFRFWLSCMYCFSNIPFAYWRGIMLFSRFS